MTGEQQSAAQAMALADEYEVGLNKMLASGYDGFDLAIKNHRLVIAALRASAPPTVWVLVIDTKHGTTVTAHRSRAALDAELYKYCDLSWRIEFADSRPADDRLIAEYWDRMSSDGEEWHAIRECEVSDG